MLDLEVFSSQGDLYFRRPAAAHLVIRFNTATDREMIFVLPFSEKNDLATEIDTGL